MAYALTDEVPDVDLHLENEMTDVIAQIIRIAFVYEIDLEKAFIEAREDEKRYLESRGVQRYDVRVMERKDILERQRCNKNVVICCKEKKITYAELCDKALGHSKAISENYS